MPSDTIFALSSGSPPAAIAVIRVSGPGALAAGAALAGRLPPARQVGLRELRDAGGMLLDHALVLPFDAPASSTGEDCLELHCHGGRAVVNGVLRALAGIDGLREALPGEFTRRAFENGRIDLTEAEGLADLLEAETESQRRAAIQMAEGGLRRTIDGWRDRLLALSARAEAAIDYVDDDGVDTDPDLSSDCGSLVGELEEWLARPPAEALREGIRVVIAGPPNVGKSSLLNALVGDERAIVTDVPGTTRDHIDVPIALAGVPLRLTDTAGLRESKDVAERVGVERARRLVDLADILLWLGDPDDAPRHPHCVLVHSRSDLPDRAFVPPGSLAVSATTRAGLSDLIGFTVNHAKQLLPVEGQIALNTRQRGCIQDAGAALRGVSEHSDLVIVAEALRLARSAFDRLTGRAGVEDLLDALFARFCLGK